MAQTKGPAQAGPGFGPEGWEADYAGRLIEWMRNVAARAGAAGAVFGLSGGVDSATVAGLAVRAFPGRCLGLILPCGSAQRDMDDALAVASVFDLPTKVVRLDGVYRSLLEAVGETGDLADAMAGPGGAGDGSQAARRKLALANLKVRLRAVTIYYHANKLNRLVVGTGNRAELSVGYFTKYGDGAADILPLANLVKGQVRSLARYLGVPEPVVAKPPTAGLWPGQTDEGEMGLTYEMLDAFLLGGSVPDDVASRIRALAQRSEHKRHPPLVPDF